jgi:hypothetical protein
MQAMVLEATADWIGDFGGLSQLLLPWQSSQEYAVIHPSIHGALVTQSSKQTPFTSEIVGLFLADTHEAYGGIQRSL